MTCRTTLLVILYIIFPVIASNSLRYSRSFGGEEIKNEIPTPTYRLNYHELWSLCTGVINNIIIIIMHAISISYICNAIFTMISSFSREKLMMSAGVYI